MPFTPSHAVLALPFVRTPLIPAAIAVGAMTPDLPLFVRGIGVTYGFTHDDGNIVWTTFIALGLFLLWRVVLRPAARELAPTWLARRLPGEWDQTAGAALAQAVGVGEQGRFYALRLVLSLMLGVLSHIVWDLFTHEGRWGSDVLPVLDQQWGPLQGFKWLQHGSSILGLAIIGVWMLVWLRRRSEQGVRWQAPAWLRVVWWVSLPTLLVGATIVGYVVWGPFSAQFTVQHLAYRVLPGACGLWALATLVLCTVLAVRRRA